MATIGRFAEIEGWQKERELFQAVYAYYCPRAFAINFALQDQIRRALYR
jgi:hypothetical protein